MLDAPPKKKRSLATLGPRISPVERISGELRRLDEAATIALVGSPRLDRALKSTISLCPQCLAYVPALVYERAGRVLIQKRCEEHGPSTALLENNARYYALSNKDRSGVRFADDRVFHIPEFGGACCAPGETCGPSEGDGTDQLLNRTCTVLVEITDACNLACRVCYSESAGDRYLPFELFQTYLRDLIAKKGRLDSVQITGGEASLHPRYWDMIAFLHAEPGVNKIYLPTNGLRFAKASERARLAPFKGKLMVLLQFDALSREASQTMRRAEPAELRQTIIADLDRLGVPMQLTMTLGKGVNEGEVGDVVDVALAHHAVKLVAMQPATWSGRYELDVDPMERLTLSDCAAAVMARASVRVRAEDFVPIPCSHPNCGWLTVFLRRFGLVHNVVKYVDLDAAMNDVAYKTMLSTEEIQKVVGTDDRTVVSKVASWLASHPSLSSIGKSVVKSTDMFSIAIKPFMDRYTYDQDRVANCCHHITDTRGGLRSFCEYNALGRRSDPWSRFPTLEGVRA
ncbi:MAG: radical SAM protein [Sandaracinus sp.]